MGPITRGMAIKMGVLVVLVTASLYLAILAIRQDMFINHCIVIHPEVQDVVDYCRALWWTGGH